MAYRRRHHRHHRRNPFGLSGGSFKDAAYVAAGAVAASALPGMVVPKFSGGWEGVAASAAASVAAAWVARMFGIPAAEVLKGGLAITVLKAVHQAGFKTPGLGLYAPSWFGVPTSSSQYLQASQANLGPYRRGAGTIFFPGPGGSAVAGPSGQQYSPAALAMSGMGYHRFRSRYAGGYG